MRVSVQPTCNARPRVASARLACCRAPARTYMKVKCYVKDQSKQPQQTPAKVLVGRRPSPPPVLVKEEQKSLQEALKAAGLTSTSSAVDMPQQGVQELLGTIRKGLDKQEQDLPKLEGAMLLAEQLFHASGGTRLDPAGASAADPQGVEVWQPIFASAGGFPRLLYIPVPEYFDMHRSLPDATAISISSVNDSIDTSSSPDRMAAAAGAGGRINIITVLGPLTTHFLGSCTWLDAATFAYSITTLRLDLGGRSFSLGLGPFKLENELSFFLATPELACARSKLGGTMLLAPEPSLGKAYRSSW